MTATTMRRLLAESKRENEQLRTSIATVRQELEASKKKLADEQEQLRIYRRARVTIAIALGLDVDGEVPRAY